MVVDDDRPLARALAINLRAHGYQVTLAHDGRTALTEITRTHPAVVVLDLGLPDLDGLEVLTDIRCTSAVPVIVLSARSTSAEKVQALDAGADDFVTKPFAMNELLARIRASVRRGTPAPTGEADAVTTPDFTIDLGAHRVDRKGGTVRLTPTEWSLLEMLVRQSGKLVTQTQILTDIWGPASTEQTHYLRVDLAQPSPQTRTRPRPPPDDSLPF